VQTKTLETISIVSLTSASSPPSPLCLAPPLPHPRSLDQLAHLVCSQAGFQTFTSNPLISRHILHKEVNQGYNLTCSQDEGRSVHCTAGKVDPPCSSILEVTCGPCTFHKSIKTNSSLQLLSPLYPDLPPGLSCLWHLEVGDGAEVAIQDLSLSSCGASYLAFNSHGKLLAHLCGEESGFRFKVQGRQVQISLESGENESGRGFRITVTAPPPSHTGKVKSILMGGVGLLVFMSALILTTLVLVRRAQARRRRPCRQMSDGGTVAWRGPAPAAGRLSTAQLARASTLNLPPPSYSFATRQLPALPSPLPEEDVMESTRIEMQREEGLNLEVSKIYESMGEMHAAAREGSNFPTPPPRPQSPIYLSLEGSGIGKVKEEQMADEPVRRRGSRLVSLQEGLRRLSSRAEILGARIRTASCADEVDDDEVFLCSIVHEHD